MATTEQWCYIFGCDGAGTEAATVPVGKEQLYIYCCQKHFVLLEAWMSRIRAFHNDNQELFTHAALVQHSKTVVKDASSLCDEEVPDIYESESCMIPLADVQHVEATHVSGKPAGGLVVVTKHTRWDTGMGFWANNLYVYHDEVEAFKSAWKAYLRSRESG